MGTRGDKVPGVTVDVEDLVRVRAHLAGLSLNNIHRRSTYRPGGRQTRVRGRGMEYEESRAYVPGDDVRTIDWRVMARTGEAHTKVFAEEKERRCLLAVDLSASMFFGTRYSFKSWTAAHTAAHVGWLASAAGDRPGGLIVAPEYHHEIAPGKTRSGLLAVLHHLAETISIDQPESNGASRLNFLLRELQRVVKPGSIIVLISDFIGVDEQSAEMVSALVKHNDVVAFWVHDCTEVEPWPAGRYDVKLARGTVGIHVGGSDSWLHGCQQVHRSKIETLTSGFEVPLFPVSCNHEVTPQILHILSN